MAFFEWKPDYSVGVEKLDDQHRKLVGYLNALYEAMKAGKGQETLTSVMGGLVDYTKTHFNTEESMMKLYRYPDYEAHREKHLKMAEHVLQLKADLETGKVANPLKITNFLKEWLAKHIMGTDKAYGPYLNGKGVR